MGRRKRRTFSDADIDRLFAMRDDLGLSWGEIAKEFDDRDTNVCTRYKYYKEKRRIEAIRAGEPIPPRQRRPWGPKPDAPKPVKARKPKAVAAPVPPLPKPVKPPEIIHRPRYFHEADADIAARIRRQGLTAGFLGDPPPGRSALDQRRG